MTTAVDLGRKATKTNKSHKSGTQLPLNLELSQLYKWNPVIFEFRIVTVIKVEPRYL